MSAEFYEYTDRDSDKLVVNRAISVSGAVYIHAGHGSHEISVRIEDDEAPALALAVLTAAGIGYKAYQPGEMRDLTDVAHDALVRHQRKRAEAQAREAEDAEVRKWMQTRYEAESGLRGRPILDYWNDLTDVELDQERCQYRAAREFFAQDDLKGEAE